MATTRGSFATLRKFFEVDLPKATEDESRRHLVFVARGINEDILQEQERRAGIRPAVTSYANTPGNTVLESVRLPGPIVYRYDYRVEIAAFLLEALRAASPVQSGAYRDGHIKLLNGVQVDQLPAVLSDTDEILITNPVPYARRIEIGKTKSGRSFVLQVPDRIYERVAKRLAMPRYREVAKIEFKYTELVGAYVTKGGLSPWYGLAGKNRLKRSKLGAAGTMKRRLRRQKPGTAIRAPAISIRSLDAPGY